MRAANQVKTGLFDFEGVTVLCLIRQSVADVGILLMAIGADQKIHLFSV